MPGGKLFMGRELVLPANLRGWPEVGIQELSGRPPELRVHCVQRASCLIVRGLEVKEPDQDKCQTGKGLKCYVKILD